MPESMEAIAETLSYRDRCANAITALDCIRDCAELKMYLTHEDRSALTLAIEALEICKENYGN